MKRILPAEWAPQSGVLFTWPHDRTDWGPRLRQVEPVFAAIAREISRRETVLVVCRDHAHRKHVETLLERAGADTVRVRCFDAPSNDSWARDHGPITVLEDGVPRLLDFTFNGWGGRYPADLDNRITRTLHAAGAFGGTPLESVDLVLEGGAVDSDGAGTLLTTRSCLLSPARNPDLDASGIEARLKVLLGVDRILWLGHGYILGDDTDGHVDTLARFCDEWTIVYSACEDPSDPHHDALRAMEAELRAFRGKDGRPYHLVPLPLPAPKYDEQGGRLPATYANFLVINRAVLAPVYDDPADGTALERLAGCFPGREVIGIPCTPLLHQYGSLHCVTMQLPAGVLPEPAGGW